MVYGMAAQASTRAQSHTASEYDSVSFIPLGTQRKSLRNAFPFVCWFPIIQFFWMSEAKKNTVSIQGRT